MIADQQRKQYRIPEGELPNVSLAGDAFSEKTGFFRFGRKNLCYGRCTCGVTPLIADSGKYDAYECVHADNGTVQLPFNFSEVVDNLRLERYRESIAPRLEFFAATEAVRRTYYFFRGWLPVSLRRHLQKTYFRGWKDLPFPSWPVDFTVDDLHEELLRLLMEAGGLKNVPFIWFWPDGAPSCAVMTHDVETKQGRDFCTTVMDLDDAYGIKASMSIVPELRYEVTREYLDSIWKRGFEVCVQDLNHDGHLFKDREEYLVRVEKINAYGKQYGATGFRSAVLYRNQMWFDQLKFSYDMSVPNVAHLEPQRGGCCTVMPYFVGDILELPVTTTQDYALFKYLNEYSIDLWRRQIDLVMEQHGLVSFIIHPDYITKPRERNVYKSLLAHLAQLRDEKKLWIPMTGEVDRWWRQRAKMTIVEDQHGVRIEGEGNERARVAYASEKDGKLALEFGTTPVAGEPR